jgi:hypothetical protein
VPADIDLVVDLGDIHDYDPGSGAVGLFAGRPEKL